MLYRYHLWNIYARTKILLLIELSKPTGSPIIQTSKLKATIYFQIPLNFFLKPFWNV